MRTLEKVGWALVIVGALSSFVLAIGVLVFFIGLIALAAGWISGRSVKSKTAGQITFGTSRPQPPAPRPASADPPDTYCPNCGTKQPANQKYCGNCGAQLA